MKVEMMDIRLWTVLVCCFTIGKTQHTTTSTFSHDVNNLLRDMEQEIDGVKSIVVAAREKMKGPEFANWDSDHILAGEIVYMYTSPDPIQPTDWINRTLNRELLKDNPSAIWTSFAHALSTALGIIGEETHAEVYRGEKANYSSSLSEHDNIKTERFFSTILNPGEKDTFGGWTGLFYRILNVTGTNIQKVANISGEAVLIKPGACFEIVKRTEDANEIKKEIKKIKKKHEQFPDRMFHPKNVIVLKQCMVGKTQHTTTSTFSRDVKSLIHNMEQEIDGVKSIVDAAREKMKGPEFDDWDSDHILAGEIVYMYTSPDPIQPTDSINRKLNRELHEDNPSAIWTRFAHALSTALGIIGEEAHAEVYRGEKDKYPSRLSERKCSKRFFSTTLNPNETDTFGGDSIIFYRILNVTGTNIQKFAVQSEEAEVLIKPGACFEIVKRTENCKEIKKEMKKIKKKHEQFLDDKFKPKEVFVLTQKKSENSHDEL